MEYVKAAGLVKGMKWFQKTQDKVLELTRRTPLSTVTKCLSKVRSAMVKYKSSDMLDYFSWGGGGESIERRRRYVALPW